MRHHTRLASFLVLAGLSTIILSGCGDDAPLAPTDPSDVVSPRPNVGLGTISDPDLSRLGRGLALALDRPELRLQVLRDMRDSPFREHSLHLQSYLRGSRGSSIAEAAAEALGLDLESFTSLMAGHPSLQFFMPIPYQRGIWKGEGPVSVTSILATEREQKALTAAPAWTSDGKDIEVPMWEPPPYPMFLVVPARFFFGPDPEARRRSAPSRARKTVGEKGWLPRFDPSTDLVSAGDRPQGTESSELTLARDLPAPRIALLAGATNRSTTIAITSADGASTAGYAPGSVHLSSGVTWTNCTNTSADAPGNADDDGLEDFCEHELARAFQPRLIFHPGEDYESRQPYWAARLNETSAGFIDIFFAPAYHNDATHKGDSEWMQLIITYDGSRWKLVRAYYSAHFGSANDNSKNYYYTDLTYRDKYQGQPYAWLGKGKHAAYNDDCNFFWSLDECDYGWSEDLGVQQGHNLGGWGPEFAIMVNCVASDQYQSSIGELLPGEECFWTTGPGSDMEMDVYFDGWHDGGDQTAHYKDWLIYFGWRDESSGTTYVDCDDDPNARTLTCD